MGLEPSIRFRRKCIYVKELVKVVGMPVGAGLRAGGVNPTIAAFGGQVAGQIAGRQFAADKCFMNLSVMKR